MRVLEVRLCGHEGLRFQVDPQALWDEVILQTLFEEVSVVVCLNELVGEPMVALPQLEKPCRSVSGSSRSGFRAGISVRVTVLLPVPVRVSLLFPGSLLLQSWAVVVAWERG